MVTSWQAAVSGFCLALGACSGGGDGGVAPGGSAPEQAAPAVPAVTPSVAFINGSTALLREPTAERKLEVTEGDKTKKVANWIAGLYRGDQVTVLEKKAGYTRVRVADDSEGWVQDNRVLDAKDVRRATVLAPTKTFKMPDIMQLNTGKTLEPGAFLFVLREKANFAEVNHEGDATVWVVADTLSYDPREVDVARMFTQIRAAEKKNDPKAAELRTLAAETYAGAQLLNILMAQPEQAPEGEGVAAADDGASAQGGSADE